MPKERTGEAFQSEGSSKRSLQTKCPDRAALPPANLTPPTDEQIPLGVGILSYSYLVRSRILYAVGAPTVFAFFRRSSYQT